MKRKLILLSLLFLMTFLLSGCFFWGSYGTYGSPVGFGVVYSSPPHGHGYPHGHGHPGGHYRHW